MLLLQLKILIKDSSSFAVLHPCYFVNSHQWIRCFEREIVFPVVRPIITGGVQVREPRDVMFYGTANVAPIDYARLRRAPAPFPACLLALRLQLAPLLEKLCIDLGINVNAEWLNCALVNYYRDGRDSMGLHNDAYPAMGSRPCILSLSFGAVRNFDLVHSQSQQVIRESLQSGSVLLMYGANLQQNWKHRVLKNKHVMNARWNISFRHHITYGQYNEYYYQQQQNRQLDKAVLLQRLGV